MNKEYTDPSQAEKFITSDDSTNSHGSQAGFTVVELLVTILVSALFIAMFYQLYTTLVQINAAARRDAQASNLAFSNLGRYTTATSTGLTSCAGETSPTSLQTTSGVDSNYPALGTITETIKAGCSGNADTVLVISEVLYNNGQSKASYATYVN